jgi:hypothetical protein
LTFLLVDLHPTSLEKNGRRAPISPTAGEMCPPKDTKRSDGSAVSGPARP